MADSERGQAPGTSIWRDLPFIIAAALGLSVSSIHFYSFGLFVKPLQAEFGWTRGEISASLMFISIAGVASAPFVGMLIDRWGSRRVGLPGVIAYAGAFALLSLTGPSIKTFWAGYILLALAITTITATVWSRAVAARFEVRLRGLAIALALCGACVGMFLAPLVADMLISRYGWRTGYVGLAALFSAMALPMILVFFRDSSAADASASDDPGASAPGLELSPREAFRSTRFWSLVVASLIASISGLSLVAHLVPLATDAGVETSVAAAAASTIAITSTIGRVGEGILLDRFRGPAISAISLLVPTLACLLILFAPPSPAWAFGIAMVLGLSVGAEVNIFAYLTSRYFGVRHYGVLFGIVYSMVILGGGLGPLMAGTIFDRTGSYDGVAWTVLILSIVCAGLILTLGPYPRRDARAAV